MRQKIIHFMMGRYGMDTLNNYLLYSSFIIMILNIFINSFILVIVGYLMIIAMIYRCLSRKIFVRESENKAFLAKTKGLRHNLSCIYKNIKDKQYKYMVCPSCKRIVRVPRNQGTIEVTCPSCYKHFDARS